MNTEEECWIEPLLNDRGGPVQTRKKDKCVWCLGIKMPIKVAAQVLYTTPAKLRAAIRKLGEREAMRSFGGINDEE